MENTKVHINNNHSSCTRSWCALWYDPYSTACPTCEEWPPGFPFHMTNIEEEPLLKPPLLERPRHKRGKLSPGRWRKVLMRDNYTCQLCGRNHTVHGVALHVDHIRPVSKFPTNPNAMRNLRTLCEDCNIGKSAKLDHEA